MLSIQAIEHLSLRMAVDQVEQWEQINPDNVDEVPVEAADFQRRVIFRV